MQCPMCGGGGAILGQLGNLVWFRCIQCGYTFVELPEALDHDDQMAPLEWKYEND